jgi:hypothetical protein
MASSRTWRGLAGPQRSARNSVENEHVDVAQPERFHDTRDSNTVALASGSLEIHRTRHSFCRFLQKLVYARQTGRAKE